MLVGRGAGSSSTASTPIGRRAREAPRGHSPHSARGLRLRPALAAAGGEKSGEPYQVVFDNAFGLTEGGDLKIAGVRAGQTTGFKVTKERPHKAVVEFEITEPGVGELKEDARCEIRPQSLIGEYFVDCQPGSSREAGRRRHDPRRADQLHDPGRPGQQHPAPPLPGAAAADHRRAGHRPGRPRRGPGRGAPPRPSRVCARPAGRCGSWPTRTATIQTFIATPRW